MTNEEKMKHFREMSLESANAQSEEQLNAYKKNLDEDFETYKASTKKMAQSSKNALMNQAASEAKKNLSNAQLKARKELNATQQKLKSDVFKRVREKIDEYKQTDSYFNDLVKNIEKLQETYEGCSMTFFITPEDEGLVEKLKDATGASIEIDGREFIGGIRCIIPEKNIIVDDSFKTRLINEQEHFTIVL